MTIPFPFSRASIAGWACAVCGVVLLILAVPAHVERWRSPEAYRKPKLEFDVYFSWVEGKRVLEGENPYARILEGNMRYNRKYATYFPGFYLLSAATQKMGYAEFDAWILLWRPWFLAAGLAVGAVLFIAICAKGAPLLALASVALWLFNRWSLNITDIALMDFLPILFMVLAMALLPRSVVAAAALFGVSLAIKQVAAPIAPLFLVWAWQEGPERRWRRLLWVFLGLSLLSVVISIPFLLWNAEGFVKSVLFSVTRVEAGHLRLVPSLDHGLGWHGWTSRLPFLGLCVLVYIGAGARQIPPACAAALVMMAFVGLNRTIFYQYFCWSIPLVLLAFAEAVERGKAASRSQEG